MKSRNLLIWIAVSLALHGAILIWPRLSGFELPPTKNATEVALVHLAPPEPVPSAQPRPAETRISKNRPRTRTQPAKAPRPAKQPPARPVTATPSPSVNKKPATDHDPKPPSTADRAPTIALIDQPSPQNPATARTATTQEQLANPSGPPRDAEGRSNNSAGREASHRPPAIAANQSEIINPPSYHINPPPVYPAMALKRRWQGEVRLRALVGEQGEVIEVTLENSSGHEVLDQAALTTVRRWKFHPASDGDGTIRKEVRLPIRFELKQSNASL
jgi:protein TonB